MHLTLIIAILMFNFLGNMSNDIFLPILPSLENSFNTTASTIKQSYSIWFLGATISQIPAALLMKIFNRRKVAFAAALGFLLASLTCSTAQGATQLIIGRFFQGISFAVCSVYTLLEVQGTFTLPQQQKIYSANAAINSASPLIGPMLGAWLLTQFSWQYNFYFICIIAVMVMQALLFSLKYKEGLKIDEANIYDQIKSFLRSYKSIFQNGKLLVTFAGPGFSTSCSVAYLMFAPYIFIQDYGNSVEKFGFFQVFIISGYLTGVAFALYIIPFDIVSRIKYGSLLILTIGISIFSCRIAGFENLNIYLGLIWLAQFGLGYSFNALIINAMSKIADTSAAASTLGMISALLCVLYASTLSLLNLDKFTIIAVVMICNSLWIKYVSKVDI